MGRLFLILVIVIIGMTLMGWLSFSSSSNSASITLDKTQMQKDTNDLKDKVQDATDRLTGKATTELIDVPSTQEANRVETNGIPASD